jgi:tetratricopeptide (TPR) repeat protein
MSRHVLSIYADVVVLFFPFFFLSWAGGQASLMSILQRKLELYVLVRGAIAYSLKNFDSAIEDFSQVIAYDPTNSEAYQQRSLALTQAGHYESALVDLDRYCSTRPNDLGSFLRLANLYSYTKHYAEAMALFARVLQMAPGSPQILYGIGLTHFQRTLQSGV